MEPWNGTGWDGIGWNRMGGIFQGLWVGYLSMGYGEGV